MFFISDSEDTLTGFRLCGIKGVLLKDKKDFKTAFIDAVNDNQTGILLISKNFVFGNEEIIDDVKLNRALPLIVEIPDRKGSIKGKDYLTDYIKAAIGIKL